MSPETAGVEVVGMSAILEHVAGLAGLVLQLLLWWWAGAGWKDWSSSEHNTNIPLYSRRKKYLGQLVKGEGVKVDIDVIDTI